MRNIVKLKQPDEHLNHGSLTGMEGERAQTVDVVEIENTETFSIAVSLELEPR
jgi:hypothetical protein